RRTASHGRSPHAWLPHPSSPHFLSATRRPPPSTLSPYTTLFRSTHAVHAAARRRRARAHIQPRVRGPVRIDPRKRTEDHLPERVDRKSTRLNSSHVKSSYAVFCLKKKKRSRHLQHGPLPHPRDPP